MRLLDLLGDDDEDDAPEPTPVPATFLATPSPADADDDGPLLPGRTRAPEPRPRPAFASALAPTPPPAARKRDSSRHHRHDLWISKHPHTAGAELGQAVADTWHSNGGSSAIEIPISIVAALALFPIKDHTEDVYRIISNCTDWELIQGYREIWVNQWSQRPDLIAHAAPLIGWLSDERAQQLIYPIRQVTDVAMAHGVLAMTESSDPGNRADTDLLSWTLTAFRSTAARNGNGEYHTPPEVADMMARILMDQLPPAGDWFGDPAAGTGGLFRASAQRLRELGGNPANYGWSMTDIDPLACACAAVNAIVWGLGPNVLIACRDILANPETHAEGLARRAALIDHRDEIVYGLAGVTAFEQAVALADRLIKGTAV